MLKQTIITILHPIYLVVSLLLSIYSANILLMTLLFWWRRLRHGDIGKSPPMPRGEIDWPVVAIQLPLYNEKQIAVRLIDKIVGMDYPNRKASGSPCIPEPIARNTRLGPSAKRLTRHPLT